MRGGNQQVFSPIAASPMDVVILAAGDAALVSRPAAGTLNATPTAVIATALPLFSNKNSSVTQTQTAPPAITAKPAANVTKSPAAHGKKGVVNHTAPPTHTEKKKAGTNKGFSSLGSDQQYFDINP